MTKKMLLSEKLVSVLTKTKGHITYGKLAERFGTNARAVGQAVRAISKTNPKLASVVVYGPTTRPKKYKTNN